MAKLGEIARIYDKARDQVLDVLAAQEEGRNFNRPGHLSVYNNKDTVLSMARAVHHELMMKAWPRERPLPHPYTHVTNLDMVAAVQNVMEHGLTKEQASNATKNVRATLAYSSLAKSMRGTGSSSIMLRAWPEGLRLEAYGTHVPLTHDERAILENRIAEEAKKTEKTTVFSFDLSIIPKPDPKPESVVAYLEKVVRCFEQLKKAYDETVDREQELVRELKELKERYDVDPAWQDAVGQITNLVR